jgi:ribonucleotide reductase alpha subunit
MNKEPFYWLNKQSRLFLERGYLEEGKEPEARYREISENAEKILGIKGFADKFYNYLSKGFYSLSTPIITNFGNKRGLPVSCFGSYVQDKMECILSKASEVGMMSKLGGGTSGYFGDLRERGAKISVGGESSGAVHFMEIYDKVANVISQGSARRGSFAAYLPIEHPDIEEFLQIRSEGHSIQNMSIGITVTDKFMKEMMEGDKEKRKLWAKVIQKRFESGYPYIMFIDTVNKNAPKVYKDKKLKIKASNLCVAPETKILTKSGNITIGENENKNVEVWNGKTWSKTLIRKTGENQKLIKVKIKREHNDQDSSSSSLEWIDLNVTEYHKFYLKNGEEVRAIDLKEGDQLLTYTDNKGRNFICEVLKVKDEGRFDNTYCVNEPLEHKAVFNGILTGNCSEIALNSDEANSFVCVLSSLNLLHWDEIKDTDAVETLIYFLDAVNEEFVDKTENVKFMEAAHNFAKAQRALGMGVLGWHSFLQSKMIAFESMQAKLLNAEIWKTIRQRADKATEELAAKFGEPELLKGYGRRNVTTLAVAPTTSSSFILGQVSPSIEPLNSNYFVKNLAKGKFAYKNPYLKETLKKYEKNNDEIWKSILVKGGSVQHLEFLSKEEKDVFKTFGEISQKEIVIQAAQRQKYIDQAQSLNIMISPDTPPKDVNSLLIEGWELGVKTFYYQRGFNPAQELARSILTCSSCEA